MIDVSPKTSGLARIRQKLKFRRNNKRSVTDEKVRRSKVFRRRGLKARLVELKHKLRPQKPLFGKDGPSGHWYIRVPLWLQSTFLIFFIGFLSILVLTVISAVQVWNYTESLMQNRLSSLAGMTAIDVEQTFNSLERSVTSSPSSTKVTDILRAANNNESTARYWTAFNREMGVQLQFSDCLGMQLYDKYLRPIYSYRKRTSAETYFGEQSDVIPLKLFPLSDPGLQSDMMYNLNTLSGGILANATVSQVSGMTKDVNLTYSVSAGISSSQGVNNFDSGGSSRFDNSNNNTDFLGYYTFVLKSQVSSTVVNELLFPHYVVEMVRLNDIHLYDVYTESLKNGTFRFLYPFVFDNGSIGPQKEWPISEFPVLLDAVELLLNARHINETSLNSTQQAQLNDTIKGYPDAENGENERSRLTGNQYRKLPNTPQLLKNNNSTEPKSRNTTSLSNSTSASQNNGTGNSSTALASLNESESSKTDAAKMRTNSPFNVQSSVGYSFANVYNQKWLIFVQIPESEAFIDARHLRAVVVGVGVGILGAVFLILLPLSKWQTKGFYVIYQNMKLRPIFIYDENAETDAEEGGRAITPGVDPSPKEGGDNHHARRVVDPESKYPEESLSVDSKGKDDDNYDADNTDIEQSKGSDHTLDNPSTSTETMSFTQSDSHYRPGSEENTKGAFTNTKAFGQANGRRMERASSSCEEIQRPNIPKPLPPLNRWFTDEVDDLIHEYNNMTEKLNAHYLHLEDQVRLRTREVQKARELREQANIAKSEFIAIISHELRTPLNGIMGLTAVSVDEDDITKIRSALRIIMESGHILMDLLNELLELSKSLVGVDPVVYEFTPDTLLETLPNMFASRTPSLSVTFALATVPASINNLKLRGDMDHIAQVCLNFMSNSMKFSEKNGHVSVILNLRSLNDPLINMKPYGDTMQNANGILEILVTDSGVGISKEQLARIFDLFVQGEDPLRKNRKGAGLGMALSKQLAEGIGGYVAVFSAKDVGTTMLVRAPVEVIGYTTDEVNAITGPPIEFKVKDVYSTISLNSGQVSAVKPIQSLSPCPSQPPSHPSGASHENSAVSASLNRSRHSYHSSGGSKMLLARAHPVSKLLRAHTQHHHNRSEYSSKSHNSQNSGSTDAVSDKNSIAGHLTTGTTVVGGITNSVIPAVTGIHSNGSASSLLLNIPETIYDTDRVLGPKISSVSHDFDFSEDSKSIYEDAKASSSSSLPIRPQQRHRPASLSLTSSATAGLSGPGSSSANVAKPSSLPPDSHPSSANSDPPHIVYISSPERSPSPVSEVSKHARILLAEDNKLNQEIMIKMLHQLGLNKVDTADDGETVIQLVEKSIVGGFHYGVIFMDLSMPGINGIDATQFIRTTLGYPYPIVALTGFSDMETRNACLAVNIQEVLTKPVMKFDIARVLQKYLSSGTSVTPPSSAATTNFSSSVRDRIPHKNEPHTR